MKTYALFLSILLILVSFAPTYAQKVVREKVRSQEKERTYHLFVPEGVSDESPAPLIVMLHGSGRNGSSLVERWRDLAKKEGIILAGPDASNTQAWRIPEDGPEFIFDLVEALKENHPVDPRRVYLFGHSGGAIVGLYLAVMESEYFAAVVVHAGTINTDAEPFIERAKRKIPIAIHVGTNDRLFPVADVRATRDLLNKHGFNAELNEIKGHTHDYYGRSAEINQNVWDFFKQHKLDGEPKYERYKF